MLRKLDHLAFRDSSNQVQMQPALAFLGLRISRGTRERIGDQRQCGEGSATNHEQQFPVGQQLFQRSTPSTNKNGNAG